MHRFDVRSPEQQAESAANEHYRELQAEVIATVSSKLSARKMSLDESDLEEAYCQAWHGVCETIKRGTPVSNLTGMLVEITWRRTVDIYRALHPEQRADVELDGHSVVDPDIDEQLDDQIKLKRFIARVRGRLNPRECEAVSLCVIHGYTRPEAAKLLGLERSQMEKLMDGATKKIGGIVASISTRGCGGDEWARLMKSYALGLIAEDDRDYPRAAAHVAECEACARYVNGLRGLAAILPPVTLPLGPLATGHGASILAHLEHLFRNGHGAGGAEALRTAGSGAAGGAGGGALASSLSAGTVAKGVAVLAAGAAAAVLAIHGGKAHHVVTRRAPAAQTQARTPPGAASASATVASSRSSGSGAAVHRVARAHGRRHSTARRRAARVIRKTQQGSSAPPATSEFGIENARYSSQPSSTSSAPRESTGSSSVSHEFGFER
jgi:DNA-directed RNA polymerase specialized sigma24 family protein